VGQLDIFGNEEDSRRRDHSEFWEYKKVLRHTASPNRLRTLHDLRVTSATVLALADALVDGFGLSPVSFRFTGRTDSGVYEHWHAEIQIRKDHIPVEVVVHEIAHHWVDTKLLAGRVDGDHGSDFTTRLDRLAEAATVILKGWGMM
jgi:hypothetical protein